ncbi:MAG TPA: sterol desaturase family protein [Sphingobacteriaceae bacterium]|nr:sterol desaturase family protein [Sphingobacteriaceae bacterium]
MSRTIFDTWGMPVLAGIFIVLIFLESRYRLRKRVQNRWKRMIINFIVAIPAFTLLRILFIPAMVWLAHKNQSVHFGLNYLYEMPAWLEATIAFLILDYGNYVWHILNHRLPVLWRFHLVHHTDRDLDITTAFRFHFGEMIGSIFFRGAITFLSGASPVTVLVYEIIFEAATQFHHSNWKLPFSFEKMLNKLIVTPRMHGIHHSVIKNETDSNYSVIFSFWDRLHKTIDLNRQQQQVVIGVPSYDNSEELTIGFLLKLPFTSIRPWKKYPSENKGNSINENIRTNDL